MMSHEQMHQAVFEHIEVGQRRHIEPGYLNPENYEKIFFAGVGGAKGQGDKGIVKIHSIQRLPGQGGVFTNSLD